MLLTITTESNMEKMMKLMNISKLLCTFLLGFSISACAQEESSTANSANIVLSDELIDKFQRNTRLTILGVAQSPIDSLYQVTTDRGIFYFSKDGQYFMNAVIFNMDKGMLNETDVAMNGLRKAKVAAIESTGIVYKSPNEQYMVNVFTDITCGYCRKLHREMQDYLDAGISIRYLAYPREGLNGDVYQQMQSIWCADNPQMAMDEAKGGSTVATQSCSNAVAEHYTTGGAVGVSGTPNIVLSNGSIIGGYQPAGALLNEIKKRLGQ